MVKLTKIGPLTGVGPPILVSRVRTSASLPPGKQQIASAPEDQRRRYLAPVVIVNALATVIAASVVTRDPTFQNQQRAAQVLSNTAQGSPRALLQAASPVYKSSDSFPLTTPSARYQPADTSLSSPLALLTAAVAASLPPGEAALASAPPYASQPLDTSYGTPVALLPITPIMPPGEQSLASAPSAWFGPDDTSQGTPLALKPASTAKPAFSWQHQSPIASWFQPADTSQSTPKTLYSDASFAPANLPDDIPIIQRLYQGLDTSRSSPLPLITGSVDNTTALRNPLFLVQHPSKWQPLDTSRGTFPALIPAAAAPFLPVQHAAPAQPAWQPLDTSRGTFAVLFPAVQTPFAPALHLAPQPVSFMGDTNVANRLPLTAAPFSNYVHQQPLRATDVADTSHGANLPLQTFVPVPAIPVQHSAPVVNPTQPLDTSQGTPAPLIAQLLVKPFHQDDWPSPIEYRNTWQQQWTFYGQNPDAIPLPPPPPPATDILISSGYTWEREKHETDLQIEEEDIMLALMTMLSSGVFD